MSYRCIVVCFCEQSHQHVNQHDNGQDQEKIVENQHYVRRQCSVRLQICPGRLAKQRPDEWTKYVEQTRTEKYNHD